MIQELKVSITERISAYNVEPFQIRSGSRLSVFTTEVKPLLTRLPQVDYEISQWVYGRRVAGNGHVKWTRNQYSVPIEHIGQKVDLRITDSSLAVYRGLQLLTTHLLLPEG